MKVRFIFVFIAFTIGLKAQNSISSNTWYPRELSDSRVSYGADINYNIYTGGGFSSFGPNASAYNYFVSPSVSYPINDKFSLTVGIMINQTQFSGRTSGSESGSSLLQRSTQAIVYASGAYRVNPNVTVFASGYYDMNSRQNTPLGMRPVPNIYSPYGSEGFSVGAEFKIGERTRIGIQMQYDKGANPYYNPFGNNFYSPFR